MLIVELCKRKVRSFTPRNMAFRKSLTIRALCLAAAAQAKALAISTLCNAI